jgi:histidinol-phosphate aminotransferase
MTNAMSQQGREDLLARGYSRRHIMRAAAMLTGAAAFSFGPELSVGARAASPDKIRIGLNECWTGPFAPGVEAAARTTTQCNRYSPNGEREALIRAISQVENIPEDHISVWPGSNIALARSVLAFCSPTKGLVTADPGYETAPTAAKWLGAPIKAVPLKADYSHDVKAMLAANPKAGLYYVVNPNNPTGTMTAKADIEWLVANKPAGAMVIIDEAYIHWSRAYPGNTATYLARAGKDVLVMRTFSKIFGMAGMRVGYFMARPDVIQKLMMFDDGALATDLPMASIACATANLTQRALINQRRQELIETRAMTEDFLKKRNLRIVGPSEANMVMVDWKSKTAKEMEAAFHAQGVQIAGPRWPIWPTVSRITIGSKSDMEGFFAALNKIVSA